MTNKMINSIQAPTAVGPYSHSVLTGDTLYISGQLGLGPQLGEMRATVEEQAKQTFINLGSILEEVEMIYDNVMKTTVFLQHMSDFNKINEIYGNYFSEVLPVRSCVEVAKLPEDDLFGIEAVAIRG